MSRRALVAIVALASAASANDLAAQTAALPSEARCLEAYDKGQRLRLKHALREARAELLLCARAPCPESFRPECLRWYDEVQAQVPSVIVRLQGDVAPKDSRLLVDGALVATRLDGKPIELDPGEHSLRCELPGSAPIEQTIVVVQGEKGRIVTLAAPRPPAETPPPVDRGSRSSIAPWIFAGVGTVALASFAYFGATGLSRRNELEKCGLYCKQEDIDYTRTHFRAADVSLGIAVVSFGVATVMWLTASPAPEKTAQGPVRVLASAGPRGGFLGIAAIF